MSTHLPTLRQLQYLIAVAEEGHFGRAAQRCFVTQSTLSAGIQELESILGITVIERTKRRVAVTPLGLELVARARRVLAEVEDMTVTAKASTRPLTGLLRLGAIPTIGPYVLPKVLPPLRQAYPDLRLFLREDRTARLVDQLIGGDLDAALIALPYDMPDLDHLVLADDPFWLAVPRGHPLAGEKGPVEADVLETEDLLLLEDGHCLRDHVLSACRRQPAPGRSGSFQATSLYTLVELVAGGFGTTLLPDVALQSDHIKAADVVLRPLSGGIGRQIALVWRRNSARRSEYKLLGQFLKNQLSATDVG
ncbi:MAG: LysR family transcriptional regulator [Rhodospirillaceae bacterium]|nr:LysR family transcriptional regulator [Magnetovibrio sp.]MAY68466.1 LysR family transcriptional regulator [Rhodospirillaceae bacterium]